MMYVFSRVSLRRMKGVDQWLVVLFDNALMLSPVDFGIAYMGGLRTEDEQKELFLSGMSTKDGYHEKSRHQYGEALDFIPYVAGQYLLPSVYHNKYYFMVIGAVYAASITLGVPVRFGANWDGDEIWVDDQNLKDYGHVELV